MSVRVKEDVYFLKVRKEVSVCLMHFLRSLYQRIQMKEGHREIPAHQTIDIKSIRMTLLQFKLFDIQTDIMVQEGSFKRTETEKKTERD